MKNSIISFFIFISFYSSLEAQTLPYENSRFGIFGSYAANEYANFIGRMGWGSNYTIYWNWTNIHFSNLSAHWTRSNMQLVWDFIEPVLDSAYNWNPDPVMTDSVIVNVYKPGNRIHWLGSFHEGSLFIRTRDTLRNPLSDTIRYKRFVQNAVERYDGDGYMDVNPNVKVKYWQIGNEIYLNSDDSDRINYIKWVKITSAAIHYADTSAKICLIAQTDGFVLSDWLRSVIIALRIGNYFNVIDIHHWGNKNNYQMQAVKQARRMLDSLGLSQVQIWSCENGTWAYQPTNQPYQTQSEQARSLIERYVYNIDLGLNKLFWNNLMEWFAFAGNPGSIYNSMGLVGDGALNGEPPQNFNRPRICYFAYKLLSSVIDADTARYSGKMSNHNEPNLYAYKYVSLTADSLARYILWKNSGTQNVSFHINTQTALVTNMITDSLGNILEEYTAVADSSGNISINIGVDPLLVREVSSIGIINISGEIPSSYILNQNYPNPFNPATKIKFDIIPPLPAPRLRQAGLNPLLSKEGKDFRQNAGRQGVVLKVYDVLGREVATLVNDQLSPSTYEVEFNGTNYPSGVYYYKLTARNFSDTKKMVLIK